MEELVVIKKVEGGKLVIDVPAEREGNHVEVSVKALDTTNTDKPKFKNLSSRTFR